jgi:hypothetical protein
VFQHPAATSQPMPHRRASDEHHPYITTSWDIQQPSCGFNNHRSEK